MTAGRYGRTWTEMTPALAPVPWFAFDGKLSWDGTLTFLGGLLAFFAIWRQVRHADDGLRRQLKAEKGVRAEEREREMCALARALSEEIKVFAEQYVEPAKKALNAWEIDPKPPGVPSGVPYPPADPFCVYHRNAEAIGEFGEGTAPIARFYGLADASVGPRKGFYEAWARPDTRGAGVARVAVGRISDSLPSLEETLRTAVTALRDCLRKGTASAVPNGDGGEKRL